VTQSGGHANERGWLLRLRQSPRQSYSTYTPSFQSEPFYTVSEKRPDQSHKYRARLASQLQASEFVVSIKDPSRAHTAGVFFVRHRVHESAYGPKRTRWSAKAAAAFSGISATPLDLEFGVDCAAKISSALVTQRWHRERAEGRRFSGSSAIMPLT
jgi:hypothetical protein